MSTTAAAIAPEIGTPVRFDTPIAGWGRGRVIDVAPHRTIAGHDGTNVISDDSPSHLDVTIEWDDGHDTFGTAPGQRSTITIGHSFDGTPWPAGWTVG